MKMKIINLAVLMLCMQLTSLYAQETDCVVFNFEEDIENVLLYNGTNCETEYELYNDLWYQGSYETFNIQPPHIGSSRFISPSRGSACGATTPFFRLYEGGIFQVLAYTHSLAVIRDYITVYVLDRATNTGLAAAIIDLAHHNAPNGWTTLEFKTYMDGQQGYIDLLGFVGPTSVLLIDSILYAANETLLRKCLAYPDVDKTEEWTPKPELSEESTREEEPENSEDWESHEDTKESESTEETTTEEDADAETEEETDTDGGTDTEDDTDVDGGTNLTCVNKCVCNCLCK